MLLKRFVVNLKISPSELWWTEEKGQNRHWYLLDISIVERQADGFIYKGFQVVFLWLHVCVGDAKSIEKIEEIS